MMTAPALYLYWFRPALHWNIVALNVWSQLAAAGYDATRLMVTHRVAPNPNA